jgi:hypothetical protein
LREIRDSPSGTSSIRRTTVTVTSCAFQSRSRSCSIVSSTRSGIPSSEVGITNTSTSNTCPSSRIRTTASRTQSISISSRSIWSLSGCGFDSS